MQQRTYQHARESREEGTTWTKFEKKNLVPCFQLNLDEFSDFCAFIREANCAVTSLCRVISPSKWRSQLSVSIVAASVLTTVQQRLVGEDGVYRVDSQPARSMPLAEFLQMEDGNFSQVDDDQAEKFFWIDGPNHQDISSSVSGCSLFPEELPIWNLRKLPHCNEQPSVRFASSGTLFPWQASGQAYISYLHFGAPVTWYAIGAKDRAVFEQAMAYLNHSGNPSDLMVEPSVLMRLNPALTIYSGVQREGEFVIVFPNCYYSGFHHGIGCIEFVHFELGDSDSCTLISTDEGHDEQNTRMPVGPTWEPGPVRSSSALLTRRAEPALQPRRRSDSAGKRLADGSVPDGVVGWAQCISCGQWHSVEREHHPIDCATFSCRMNIWNPGVAQCLSEETFLTRLRSFFAENGSTVLLERPPSIYHKPFPLYWFYNSVIMLGGWNTVLSNALLPVLYRELPMCRLSSIGNKCKLIYERYLLAYEERYFYGKRYATVLDRYSLFGSMPDGRCGQLKWNMEYWTSKLQHPTAPTTLTATISTSPNATTSQLVANTAAPSTEGMCELLDRQAKLVMLDSVLAQREQAINAREEDLLHLVASSRAFMKGTTSGGEIVLTQIAEQVHLSRAHHAAVTAQLLGKGFDRATYQEPHQQYVL